ncbi:MAG TPA: hypothetical protein PKJ97_02585 [Candidatus Bilamarchaeaceae archaeon]|nr:hypothetical protein [Candidatus Bilamarchaeaceae archaeon]
MAKTVSPRDIGGIIEVRKRIAELTYKRGYAMRKGDQAAMKEASEELAGLEVKKANLEKKASGIEVYFPFQGRTEELGAGIAKHGEEEVDAALVAKSGELYKMLCERGKLLRRNMEAKNEIGKVVLIGMTVAPEVRAKLVEAVRAGKAPDIDAAAFGPNLEKLVAALNRSGIGCKVAEGRIVPSEEDWVEEKVVLNNSHVWIPKQSLDKFVQNEMELERMGVRLQIKNAEKQVKNFSEDEMKEFEGLQGKYLDLMRVRKDLTAGYEKEIVDLELQ